MAWWLTYSVLSTAVTVVVTAVTTVTTTLLALRRYNQLHPIPEASPVGKYLQVNFAYQGQNYLTYLRHYPKMAAQGWRVSQPDGEVINFYPGALPTVTVADLQPDCNCSHWVVKKGTRLVRPVTELNPQELLTWLASHTVT